MKRQRPLVAVFDLVTSVAGVQTVMKAVLPRLSDRFDIVVIDPYNNPDYAENMRGVGIPMVSLGSAPERRFIGGAGRLGRAINIGKRAPWMLLTILRLRRWIRHNCPDVVYFNQVRAARLFARAIPRRGPALVYHAHGFLSHEGVGRATAGLLSRRFTWALAVSKITGNFLIEAGTDPGKVKVVYNAMDPVLVAHKAQSDGPPLPVRQPNTVVVTHVAVLNRHKKAQHLSIEALGRISAASRVQVWICGSVQPGADESYLEYLRNRVEALGLRERVHFLGWRTDVPRVLAASDVCILPSLDHSEACPMVLLEAMTLGKPCIGSTFGGIPEIIEDGVTGFVCPAEVEDLAAAMHRLGESSELRAAMGEAGRRRAAEVFSITRQTTEIADLLQSASESRRT